MTTAEVRLNNLILFKDEVVQVTSIDTCIVTHGERQEADIDQCSGIPLNEEWLIKLGFEKYTSYVSAGYWKHEKMPSHIYLPYLHWDNQYCAPVQYVHTLQNLYFALTGQELTIKE